MASHYEVPVLIAHQGNSKYRMWDDIGLGAWCVELDDITGAQLSKKLIAIYRDYPKAKATIHRAMDFVRGRHEETMSHLRVLVGVGE
jgi:hypothetical protein